MFLIVFSLGVGANKVDFLKNVINERRRIFTIVQDIEVRGRPILFNRLFLTDTDTDLFSITDPDI